MKAAVNHSGPAGSVTRPTRDPCSRDLSSRSYFSFPVGGNVGWH